MGAIGRPLEGKIARAEAGWATLYRVGGIAGLLAFVLYLVAVVLVFTTPPLPSNGGADVLEYVAANRTMYVAKQLLWLAPSFLAMLVFLALYVALRDLDRSVAAIGGMIGVAGWALGFAWPTTGEGGPVLVYLSDQYVAAGEAQRAAFVAAAEAFIALNNLPSALGELQTAGVLVLSIVMLKGVFPRSVAYLGIATGTVGVVSEALRPVMGIGYALYGVLIVVWFGVVGWRLYRLDSRQIFEGDRLRSGPRLLHRVHQRHFHQLLRSVSAARLLLALVARGVPMMISLRELNDDQGAPLLVAQRS